MERVRNVLADVLVGIAIIVGALWILRGVFRFVYWGASMIVVLIAIIVILRVASKLRQ